ncbi:MAG: hypothetical protein GXY85_06055 [Candidatus Brocadiaceae bacterium]|nr:hypothetical protein [Candidatus Brocadiaceae bacterium]
MSHVPDGKSTRLLRILLLAAVPLSVAFGCHYPQALRTYEYVVTHERMSAAHEPLLSLVYVPRSVNLRDYRGIVIGEVGVGRHWVETPDAARQYAQLFRVLLRRELLEQNRFHFVSMDPDDPRIDAVPGKNDVLLFEGMITRLDEGSGVLRYLSFFLWFLQAGATDLQIEGRILEAESGRLVVEFVDRRRHLCNTPFGPNPKTIRDGYAMHVTAHLTAEALAEFIARGWNGLPVARADGSEDASPKGRS